MTTELIALLTQVWQRVGSLFILLHTTYFFHFSFMTLTFDLFTQKQLEMCSRLEVFV